MATGQVQLSASAQGVANAAGSATMTFPAVRLTRTWQGSVSISGAPRGTRFTVSVGGQALGTLFAPGPFGPVQVLSGQSLQVMCTGLLVNGTNYIANISGVDDPSNDATPYAGPVAVTITNDQGGLLSVKTGASVSGTTVPVLPAPGPGLAYRLQSLTISGQGTSQDQVLVRALSTTFNFFATTLQTTGVIGQTFLMNGQLIADGIGLLYVGTAGSSYFMYLFYDLVAI